MVPMPVHRSPKVDPMKMKPNMTEIDPVPTSVTLMRVRN